MGRNGDIKQWYYTIALAPAQVTDVELAQVIDKL
jgi:hypothetical protein